MTRLRLKQDRRLAFSGHYVTLVLMPEQESNSIASVASIGAGIGAGIGLVALIETSGKRLQKIARAKLAEIREFESELETLINDASQNNELNNFAYPIDLASPYLNAAVAVRLRDPSTARREDLFYAFESYRVTSASARPMRNHPELFIRRMSQSFLGSGVKFDIVGENNLYEYNPLKYQPKR